jgi:DNA adenine methylase
MTHWTERPQPFLKWAGGKSQMLRNLGEHFPRHFSKYYEPFLGGGAVFFRLVERYPPFDAVLSDCNEELINAYEVVKTHVEQLVETLKIHEVNYVRQAKDYYYQVRKERPFCSVERAARLIFLNKTCYNGLYRVNRKSEFNVPFGRYENPRILDEENLRKVSRILNLTNAKVLTADYQDATKDASNGDFIYFDPPYQPVSSTANFTSYTHTGFSLDEQKRLGVWFKELDRRGCTVLLSNSDTTEVRDIYSGYNLETVPAVRVISCKGNKRKDHSELIICNQDHCSLCQS